MKLPKNNKNIKAIKMALESIAHQFNNNEIKKLYSEEEILEEIKTPIQQQYYFRLENIQFVIIDYINELSRLQLRINKNQLINTQSRLINTTLETSNIVEKYHSNVYYGNVMKKTQSDNEYKALIKNYEKLKDITSKNLDKIKTGTDEIKSVSNEQLVKDVKKYYVIINIIRALGNTWGLKGYIDIYNTFIQEIEKMKSINNIKNFNVNVSSKVIKEIEKIVATIDTNPPIYYGYYITFEKYEDEVEVEVFNG